MIENKFLKHITHDNFNKICYREADLPKIIRDCIEQHKCGMSLVLDCPVYVAGRFVDLLNDFMLFDIPCPEFIFFLEWKFIDKNLVLHVNSLKTTRLELNEDQLMHLQLRGWI